jgi:hypothetical protein
MAPYVHDEYSGNHGSSLLDQWLPSAQPQLPSVQPWLSSKLTTLVNQQSTCA